MKPALLVPGFFFSLALVGCFDRSKAVRIPDIVEAPQFVSEKRLEFSGVAHPQLAGGYSWIGGTTGAGKTPAPQPREWRYVVPVTAPNWSPNQPVPLWVTFNSTRRNQESLIAALHRSIQTGEIAGVNVDFPSRTTGVLRGESPWQQAVKDAETRHGLTSDPRAPIVSWRPER